MATGKTSFMLCGACHGMNGEGGPLAPPLAGSDWVKGPVSNLIRIQLRGLQGPITVSGKEYNLPAPMAALSHGRDGYEGVWYQLARPRRLHQPPERGVG